jgi:hypothetical protein
MTIKNAGPFKCPTKVDFLHQSLNFIVDANLHAITRVALIG